MRRSSITIRMGPS